jgi:GNAT superfamily N-acetyltransferase
VSAPRYGGPSIGELAYRRARDDEGPAIAGVWLRSRGASVPQIPSPVHTPEEVLRWFSEVVLPRSETWVVATPAGQIIGLLVLDGAWLDQLYIEPGWTGRGIGSLLLRLANQRRPDGLDLWVFQSNTRARKFYEDRGFVLVETTDGDNEEGAPDAHYAWASEP